ncbi:hypothetical protein ACFWBC_00275 [Streptomyces sp. NPDC059985]|uniref:hypothetical protein n=1 Tax=Streptomyces sp. NPDC059985 TaxID=3347025 RepID=UPI0036755A4A
MQERWESRQGELAEVGEAREVEAIRRHNARVENLELVIVQQAAGAYARGDGWFEAEIEHRSAGGLQPYGGTGMDLGGSPLLRSRLDEPGAPRAPRSDLLSRIEDEGWSLHTAQYVYVQLGAESREKWFSSGERVAVKGKIVGMYLFRRA